MQIMLSGCAGQSSLRTSVQATAGEELTSGEAAERGLGGNDMDPQTVERAIKRCIDISICLGALEDEAPAPGSVIVQCVDDIDEMQRWLEGRE